MTEFHKFIVTLPVDAIQLLRDTIRVETIVGDVSRAPMQIAAALVLATELKLALSGSLPGLAVALLENSPLGQEKNPDPLKGIDSLSFFVMPPDGISVSCVHCDFKSGGNTVYGQGIKLALKTVLEHVEEKHG